MRFQTFSPTDTASVVSLDIIWERLAGAQVRRRRALGLLAIVAIVLSPWVASAWPEEGWVNQGLEWLGLVLMGLAVLGRCGCMLYLSGRKGAELVASGPYSVSRNPLYVFSIIAVFGIGLQTASLAIAMIVSVFATLIFRWITSREELLLAKAFGPAFDAYCATTPRFLPRWSAWRSPQHVEVDVFGVWRTLRDALPYFLAVPLLEAVEAAQRVGWVHARVFLF